MGCMRSLSPGAAAARPGTPAAFSELSQLFPVVGCFYSTRNSRRGVRGSLSTSPYTRCMGPIDSPTSRSQRRLPRWLVVLMSPGCGPGSQCGLGLSRARLGPG